MRYLALSLLLVGCAVHSPYRRAPEASLGVAYWYWHSPVRLTPPQLAELRQAGVDRVLCRAMTLSYDGQRPVAILPQRYEPSPNAPPLHLVVNADAGLLRHFEELRTDRLAQVLEEALVDQASRAHQAGYRVVGWQLDLDVPTRLLPRYADLLTRLRSRLPKGVELSLTGLQSWMDSPHLTDLLRPVDAWYPQFYEGRLPRTPAEVVPLSDLPTRYDPGRFGKPFWIGIAAYGHCLVYDAQGRRAGVLRGLPPDEALGRPGLHYERGDADSLVLRVSQPVERRGWRLVYRLSSPATLTRDVRLAREMGAAGIALFRYPAAGDATALPVAALIQGDRAEARLALDARFGRDPYALIERPGGSASAGREFTLRNVGEARTALCPDAVRVTVAPEQGRLLGSAGGDFREANGAYVAGGMRPGASLRLGPFLTTDGTRLRLHVLWTDTRGKRREMVTVR